MILLFPCFYYFDDYLEEKCFADFHFRIFVGPRFKLQNFSEAKPHTVSEPSEDQLEDKFNLFLWFPLPDSVGIDSITGKSCQCLSVNVAHFKQKKEKKKQFPLCALTRTYHSTSTVVILFFFPSVHVSMHSDPCRIVSR